MAKLLGGTTVYGLLSAVGSVYASDLTTSSGSISASRPSLSSTQTWNNSAVAFAALTTYITNSSSNIESTLIDVGINGSSVAKIQRDGNFWTVGSYISNGTFSIVPNSTNASGSGATQRAWCTVTNGLVARQNLGIHSSNGAGAFEVAAYSGGANIWEQRNGTNAQTFNLYNTYTSATINERAYFKWTNNQFLVGTESPGLSTKRDVMVVAASGTGNIFLSGTNVLVGSKLFLGTTTSNNSIETPGDGSTNFYFGSANNTRDFRLSLQNDRNLVVYTGSTANWTAGSQVSDANLKTNIRQTSLSCVDILKLINVVDYEWSGNSTMYDGGNTHTGFLAQDLENVVPDSVANIGETKLLLKQELVPILWKALQEAFVRIEQLETFIQNIKINA